MKRHTKLASRHQPLAALLRLDAANCASRIPRRSVCAAVALGLASLGAGAVLSGCDGWDGSAGGLQSGAQRSTYIDRKVDSTYEGIALNPDGTYSRTVVDGWGRSYQQQGTWRGYGGTFQNGKARLSRRLELDGYSDAGDVISNGSTQAAPKSTKTLSSGDFYTR